MERCSGGFRDGSDSFHLFLPVQLSVVTGTDMGSFSSWKEQMQNITLRWCGVGDATNSSLVPDKSAIAKLHCATLHARSVISLAMLG